MRYALTLVLLGVLTPACGPAGETSVTSLAGQWGESPASDTGVKRLYRFRDDGQAALLELAGNKVTCTYARVKREGEAVSVTRMSADGKAAGRTDDLVATFVDTNTIRLRLAAEPVSAERTYVREAAAPPADICSAEGVKQ